MLSQAIMWILKKASVKKKKSRKTKIEDRTKQFVTILLLECRHSKSLSLIWLKTLINFANQTVTIAANLKYLTPLTR